jgi:hypothetical protein
MDYIVYKRIEGLCMAKKQTMGKLLPFGVLLLAILVSCTSTSSSSGGPYFSGTGGGGMSITILPPKGVGITEDQRRVVQGELIDNFTTYSKISILDRMNLDDTYSELLSGYYEDENAGVADLGHMNPTQYIMYTTIIQNSMGYNLQIQISRTSDKMMEASFSETCTSTELDNLTAIHRATSALLPRLGVNLTERAKTALSKPSTTQQVNSQIALAKGIEAQRRGTVIEAMSYYYEATALNSLLIESTNKLADLSVKVKTGNIGVDARNSIAARNSWLEVMRQCGDFYLKHLPLEINYSTKVKSNNLNYAKGTVDLSFDLTSSSSSNVQLWQDVLIGLGKTGKKKEWNILGWPVAAQYSELNVYNLGKKISFSYRRIFGVNLLEFRSSWPYSEGFAVAFSEMDVRNTSLTSINNQRYVDNGLIMGSGFGIDSNHFYIATSLNIALVNDVGVTIATKEVEIHNRISVSGNSVRIASAKETIKFTAVDAFNITDTLALKILSVNGIPLEEAAQSGYIKIVNRD